MASSQQYLMLANRFFFPLFVLVIALVVYGAFAFGPRPDVTPGPLSGDPLAGFLIKGEDLRLLNSGPGLTDEIIIDREDGIFIRAAAGQPIDRGTPHAGTFLALRPDIGQAWQGHTLYISVALRRPELNGSDDVTLRFYAVEHGNSEAVHCTVTEQWTPCFTQHFVPPSDKLPNLSFIGIWPDTKGLGRSIDIQQIEVRVDQPFLAANIDE